MQLELLLFADGLRKRSSIDDIGLSTTWPRQDDASGGALEPLEPFGEQVLVGAA